MKNFLLLLVSFLTLTSGFYFTEGTDFSWKRLPATEKDYTSQAQKIGILFGTFDPPHIGHKSLALAMKEKFGLDVVYFIPRDKEDYKPNKQSITVRNKLVELMLEDTPSLKLISPSVAAGVKRLRSEEAFLVLRQAFPENQVSLILGDDTLMSLSTNQVRIPEGFQLLVARRSGNEHMELPSTLDGKPVHILKVMQESSSTSIRRILNEGGVPDMLSPNVYGYIKKHKLYSSLPNTQVMGKAGNCMEIMQRFTHAGN